MRVSWRPLLAIPLLAGAGGVAVASPQFASTAAVTFASATPRAPTGLDVTATWSDPGAAHAVPKAVTKMRFAGPPGTKFDTAALPRCRASDEDIANLSLRACPRGSIIGTVKGEGVIVTSGNPFNTVATLFNARRKIIVVVTLVDDGRLITYFRDDVRGGAVDVNLKIPGGVALTKFQAHLPRHFRRYKGKRRAYLRTPPKCPAAGVWTVQATFDYRDGSTQQLASNTPCKQG